MPAVKPIVIQTSPTSYDVHGTARTVHLCRFYTDEGAVIRPHGRAYWWLTASGDSRFHRECSNKREALAHAKALSNGGDVDIESQTDLLVEVIAEAVVGEAAGALDTIDLFAKGYEARMAERAEKIYRNNWRFRRMINAKGNAGRDWLYAFMRHWLSAIINREHPALYSRLPSDFARGHPLMVVNQC